MAKQPLQKGSLSAFRSASVEVVAQDPSAKNSALHVDTLRAGLLDELQNARLFETVQAGGEGSDVALKVTILQVGTEGLAVMGTGDASCQLSVELVNGSDGSVVAAFEATGNSKSNTNTSIGGVDTKALSDQSLTALKVAAGHIVDHLRKQN